MLATAPPTSGYTLWCLIHTSVHTSELLVHIHTNAHSLCRRSCSCHALRVYFWVGSHGGSSTWERGKIIHHDTQMNKLHCSLLNLPPLWYITPLRALVDRWIPAAQVSPLCEQSQVCILSWNLYLIPISTSWMRRHYDKPIFSQLPLPQDKAWL